MYLHSPSGGSGGVPQKIEILFRIKVISNNQDKPIKMENNTILTSLEETKNDVTALRQIIYTQAAQIDLNQQMIRQILGGLLNEKQQKVLKSYLSMLYGDKYVEEEDDEDEDEEEEDQRFTTRQGDEHEERLNALEAKFWERDAKMTLLEEKNRVMEAKIEEMEKRQLERLGLNL